MEGGQARRLTASLSHCDDAMIPARSKRMTVAQLKVRMDARFAAVDRRFDRLEKRFDRFETKIDKTLDEILSTIKAGFKHHNEILDEHDERLKDLESWRRTSQ